MTAFAGNECVCHSAYPSSNSKLCKKKITFIKKGPAAKGTFLFYKAVNIILHRNLIL